VSTSSRTGGRTCTHPGVDEEGPRESVRRHWKMTMGKIKTFTLPSCAASFTCSPFTCRPPLPLGLFNKDTHGVGVQQRHFTRRRVRYAE